MGGTQPGFNQLLAARQQCSPSQFSGLHFPDLPFTLDISGNAGHPVQKSSGSAWETSQDVKVCLWNAHLCHFHHFLPLGSVSSPSAKDGSDLRPTACFISNSNLGFSHLKLYFPNSFYEAGTIETKVGSAHRVETRFWKSSRTDVLLKFEELQFLTLVSCNQGWCGHAATGAYQQTSC